VAIGIDVVTGAGVAFMTGFSGLGWLMTAITRVTLVPKIAAANVNQAAKLLLGLSPLFCGGVEAPAPQSLHAARLRGLSGGLPSPAEVGLTNDGAEFVGDLSAGVDAPLGVPKVRDSTTFFGIIIGCPSSGSGTPA